MRSFLFKKDFKAILMAIDQNKISIGKSEMGR